MSQVLIYELNYTGHHFAYVRSIIQVYAESGYEVELFTSEESVGSAEYKEFIAPLAGKFKLTTKSLDVPVKSLSLWRYSWIFFRLIREKSPRFIFAPYLDTIFYCIGVLGMICRFPTKVQGILFRGDYAYRQLPWTILREAKGFITAKIIERGPFEKVLCLDEIVFKYLSEHCKKSSNRLVQCPEPVDVEVAIPQAEARAQLGLPKVGKIIGTFGVLDSRKGVDILIDAFMERDIPKEEYLLLAGPQHKEIVEKITYYRSRYPFKMKYLIEDNSFLSPKKSLLYLSAMDIVALLYPRHIGSSSILLRALALKKTILASDFGLVGHIARRAGCMTVDCNKKDEIRSKLLQMSAIPSLSSAFKIPSTNDFKKVIIDAYKN